ncbi:class I SAM-dependent methyltransferase, partial [Galactobacter sp.]|uniref:class I SAM-dependent methyltransferase n=1 Tax=Galactobacter sp. TaxID=2676125 RepID=UPI0025C6680D
MPSERVKTAYGARADEYIEAVGRIEHAAAADLTLIRAWALGCSGPLLDVGCGPGQWTHWLHDQGAEITGVDPVPEFVERARAAYPDASYRL